MIEVIKNIEGKIFGFQLIFNGCNDCAFKEKCDIANKEKPTSSPINCYIRDFKTKIILHLHSYNSAEILSKITAKENNHV